MVCSSVRVDVVFRERLESEGEKSSFALLQPNSLNYQTYSTCKIWLPYKKTAMRAFHVCSRKKKFSSRALNATSARDE